MRFFRVILLLLLLSVIPVAAQDGDFDGDGVPDSQDYCIIDPGTVELNGCTAENFPDFDQDTVADPVDSCPNDPGLPTNSGCAEGVIPDFDGDSVTDALDQCPREYGEQANGCPPDADGDLIADFVDACPLQAGVSLNLGCPDGVNPPDDDADGTPDLYDSCLGEAGAPELGGCLDSDADGTADRFDVCPDQAGAYDLFGCAVNAETLLPAALTPINAGNAAAITEVGRVVTGPGRMAVTGNTLVLRGDDQVYRYDLNAAALAPISITGTGYPNYPLALNATGTSLALLDFPADFNTPPFVQIRDAATGNALFQLVPPPDASGEAVGVAAFAFSPRDPALLVVAPLTGGTAAVGVTVPLFDVTTGQIAAQFPLPGGAVNLGFSRDGARFAVDVTEVDTMSIYVFDVAARNQVARLTTTDELHFAGTPLALNGDGTALAAGYPDGSVHGWDVTGFPVERFTTAVFSGDEIASAVAYSPDGSVIAVAGGVPFSGGLTGEEVFSIVLLNARTGAELARWSAHQTLIRDLAFNDAGTLLISSGDASTRFWGISG